MKQNKFKFTKLINWDSNMWGEFLETSNYSLSRRWRFWCYCWRMARDSDVSALNRTHHTNVSERRSWSSETPCCDPSSWRTESSHDTCVHCDSSMSKEWWKHSVWSLAQTHLKRFNEQKCTSILPSFPYIYKCTFHKSTNRWKALFVDCINEEASIFVKNLCTFPHLLNKFYLW